MNRTHHIPKPWNKRYVYARIALFSAFVSAGAAFSFLILFPSQSFVFDFKNPGASKNTLLDPHAPDNTGLGKGNIANDTSLIMDAALEKGDYSLLDISFAPDKKADTPQGSVTIRKSYRAFFLPEGAPVSEEARFDGKFRSGSLLAFADGVFLIDGNMIRPIGDATIFENLGYDWNDVIPAGEEEMGLYEKGKIVLMGNMHPDGTVFQDTDTQDFFLIQGGEKHKLLGDAVVKSYLQGTHPVLASVGALDIKQSCTLSLGGFLSKTYTCSTPIDTLKNLPGDSYRLTADFDGATSLQSAQATFADTVNRDNMMTSLGRIKQRIFSHYGYGQ